jgi:hypothetical protein
MAAPVSVPPIPEQNALLAALFDVCFVLFVVRAVSSASPNKGLTALYELQ